MEKVSIIIPTYNRFKYLLNAVNSVKNQTYKNIEIIVINDCSTQQEYYQNKIDNVIMIHLDINSKNLLGFGCAAKVRNHGIEIATGDYIAFLDDDDIWFPRKIELQIKAMKETGCKMSSTEALTGNGIFDSNKYYPMLLQEKYLDTFKMVYLNESKNELSHGYPKIWNHKLNSVRNLCIASSVMIEKSIINYIGKMKLINSAEDYDYWQRALEITDSVFINEPCVYYDNGHGDGQNY